jgi:hypothetical protein
MVWRFQVIGKFASFGNNHGRYAGLKGTVSYEEFFPGHIPKGIVAELSI